MPCVAVAHTSSGISVLLMRCIWMYHAHLLNSDVMDLNSIGIINVVLSIIFVGH